MGSFRTRLEVQSLAAFKNTVDFQLDFFEASHHFLLYQLLKIKSADVTNVLPKLTPFFEGETLVIDYTRVFLLLQLLLEISLAF